MGFKKHPKQLISRRTQTYLRELLELEGHDQKEQSAQSIIMEDDAEID